MNLPSNRIQYTALYEEVAERLRQQIFSGELAQGNWIDEQAIAEIYGISRTPMREALKVLASEGLVTLKPRRGCYVTELNTRDIDEIFPILAKLEGLCASLAAIQATDKQRESLEKLHHQLEQKAQQHSIEAFFSINQEFHLLIQTIANNQRLEHIIQDLRKVLKLVRHNSLRQQGRLEASLAEHKNILNAIQQRDAVMADKVMYEHIMAGYRSLNEDLSNR